MDHLPEEIALLSSLRFAPTDPIPARRPPSALPSDSLAPSTTQHTQLAESLQLALRSLVHAHQGALLDPTGGSPATIRNAILTCINALRSTLSGSLDTNRFEIIKLMGLREDSNVTASRISKLQERVDDALESRASSLCRDKESLATIDVEIQRLEGRLRELQTQRTTLHRSIKHASSSSLSSPSSSSSSLSSSSLSQRQWRHVQRAQEELETLKRTAAPDVHVINAEIQRLEELAGHMTREIEALEEGGHFFSEVIAFLKDSEQRVARVLRSLTRGGGGGDDVLRRTDPRTQHAMEPGEQCEEGEELEGGRKLVQVLDDVVDKLTHWLDFVDAKGWNLLTVLMACELESYRRAQAFLPTLCDATHVRDEGCDELDEDGRGGEAEGGEGLVSE